MIKEESAKKLHAPKKFVITIDNDTWQKYYARSRDEVTKDFARPSYSVKDLLSGSFWCLEPQTEERLEMLWRNKTSDAQSVRLSLVYLNEKRKMKHLEMLFYRKTVPGQENQLVLYLKPEFCDIQKFQILPQRGTTYQEADVGKINLSLQQIKKIVDRASHDKYNK